jgi:hypothetical protein
VFNEINDQETAHRFLDINYTVQMFKIL